LFGKEAEKSKDKRRKKAQELNSSVGVKQKLESENLFSCRPERRKKEHHTVELLCQQ